MNLESFDDFLEWFKTNRYVSVAEPSFDAEASKIKSKCLHCQQDPFTVFPVKKGGWNRNFHKTFKCRQGMSKPGP